MKKLRIQVLDRTQRVLRPGQPERRTHDYTQDGTINLFAAFNTKTGRIIGQFHQRHRAVGFRKFPDAIETAVPVHLDAQLILDNYGTHKTPLIHRRLARHPHFHTHFAPTDASWINVAERWFAALMEKDTRGVVHRSTRELQTAIEHSIRDSASILVRQTQRVCFPLPNVTRGAQEP